MIENYFNAVYRVETSTRDENIITISPLNSLKPFEFEPKTNIRDINISSSDDEEKGTEDKAKRIGDSEWCQPSRQILVPRTSRGRLPITSPGRPLRTLFDHPGVVPI